MIQEDGLHGIKLPSNQWDGNRADMAYKPKNIAYLGPNKP